MQQSPAAHQAEALARALAALGDADTLPNVTATVTHAVREIMEADGATFVLREDGNCFYADEEAISPLWQGMRFPLETCVSGYAMLSREIVIIPDIYVDDRVPIDAYRPTFVKSLCMAPVRSQDPIGALGAYWAEQRTPTTAQVRLLQMLANSAAVAVENLELRGAVRRRSAERDRFAARTGELESAMHTLVHDLRNPLGAMLGYAELIEEVALADPEKAVVFAGTIRDAGQRMGDQIERMLALYRITHKPIEPSPVDVSALAREVAAQLVTQRADRDVEFVIADGLVACADAVLVRLLLENLVGNAFKYTGRTARARIEVALADASQPGQPGQPSASGQPLTTFVVRDNGAGFDPDDAGLLFSPMTRLHEESDFPGTGLGLASVARIVELHGGTVRADGRRGEGAAFFFSLPALD